MKMHRALGMAGIAGLVACLGLLCNGAFGEGALRVTTDENAVTVLRGDQMVLAYRYGNVPRKPYVQEFRSPAGVNVLRDNVADHIHHHALMFALAVDGVDFWSEAEACGVQQHRSFDAPAGGRFTDRIDWVQPGGQEVLLTERRTIEVLDLKDEPVSLLAWESVLELPQGKEGVTLTGSHYFGLGMRFLQSMDAKGRFSNAGNAPGEIVRGDERNVASDWCAYTAEADGKPVTVAMFSHPGNVRHPATWFTMATPFAYMSATLNLHKEPLVIALPSVATPKNLAGGNPLVLRYAVALWDGKVEPDRINRLYQRWTVGGPGAPPAK